MALWLHRGLCAAILLMLASGMTMALTGKLKEIVFARSGAPLTGALKDRATLRKMLQGAPFGIGVVPLL